MKKRLALLMALCLVITGCLTASGDSAETGEPESQEQEATNGETVDVGDFTVFVPTGWMKLPMTDAFGEQDAEGNYPIRTDYYGMIKGGEAEFDAFTKPTVYVTYYAEEGAEEQAEYLDIFYEEVTPIDVTVNGQKVTAFTCKDSTGWTHQDVYIPVTDSSCFQVDIPVDMDGTPGVSFEDADVMAIMESLTVK
ncbi:MAG: hypothetical protein IJU01_01445 [Lachnospiraceae bacterium]|nr:hypothetical protein [Lachnospiraceae bacterium]